MVAWIETVCYNPKVESAQTVGDPVAPDRAEASDTSGAVLSISPAPQQESEMERVVAALDRLSDRLDEITATVARSPFLSRFRKVRSKNGRAWRARADPNGCEPSGRASRSVFVRSV